VTYWYGGGVILDISDMTRPRMISNLDWSPPFGWPTHGLVPELVGIETPLMTACHQSVETISGNEVPAARFASGLRVIDSPILYR
jgi:hypothetical protein